MRPLRGEQIQTPAGTVSKYVAQWTPHSLPGEQPWALDLPCGRGRHSYFLASKGYRVTAVDNDSQQLSRLAKIMSEEPGLLIEAELGDANQPLPFAPDTFDLAITTHFVSRPLIASLGTCLKPGGLLIYESFAGHGGNWSDLPEAGEIAILLEPKFDVLDYRERHAGPAAAKAVVACAVARKR